MQVVEWVEPGKRAMADQTILVVEDDAQIRKLLRNVMEDEGFAVLEAETAAQALKAIEAAPISLPKRREKVRNML